MRRYFYHYATQRQIAIGSMALNDGTIDCAWMIDSSERYQEALRGIAEHIGAEVGTFSLTSLTLLNPQEDTPDAAR